MEEQWQAGLLPREFDTLERLPEPHAPTGILDEYRDGQEDEGVLVDDDDQPPWNDLCPGIEDEGEVHAESSGMHEEAARASELTPDQALHADEQAANIAKLDTILDEARALGDDKIDRFIFQCRAEFLRRATGREAHPDVVKAVRRAASLG